VALVEGTAMPHVFTNGIRLSFERRGTGDRVLLIMGSSAGGRVWTMHQTPALNAAGFQAITLDNRGVPPSDVPPGRYSLADMVADTRGVIEALDAGPCRLIGVSLGALIAQELAIDHPEIVHSAVLLATKGRSDAARRAHARAAQALAESGVDLPKEYAAFQTVSQMLSPSTIADDREFSLWLETLEQAPVERVAPGQQWADLTDDRLPALAGVRAPCRVIAFADDLVTPPHLGREVAAAIPDCDYVEIAHAGHLGYLERPDETNRAVVEFTAHRDN